MPTPLGDKIRKLRKDKSMSLDALAEAADMSKSYLWELENRDTANPTMDKVAKIATVLGVTPEFLTNDEQSDVTNTVADKAFFRKYEKLPPETKKQLQDILKVIQKNNE